MIPQVHAGRPPEAGRLRLRDRWLGWRDRLLASPTFQASAARFPLTRWIARRRARAVFDLVAGFVYSQILLACVRLRLFDVLAGAPLTAEAVAPRIGLEAEAAERLLAAAVALRLLERRGDGRYGLGALGAPLVGNVGLAAMIEHHGLLYADLADPVALLRGEPGTGRLAAYWPYAGADDPGRAEASTVGAYSALMSASQTLVASEILAAHRLSAHRCLLDVGGGEGTFLIAASQHCPSLRLMLFDLPAVAERATERFAAAGLAGRAEAFGGSFLVDPLPAGADVVSLVRVLHDHDDARVAALLRSVYEALVPGGTVLVAEPMAGTAGAEAMGDAYFGFYLLAMGRGRPRTAAGLTSMLHDAGFVSVSEPRTGVPLQVRLLVARKPSRKP